MRMTVAASLESIPEGLSAEAVGQRLAARRQDFSLTRQQVAEHLHIRERYILAMEQGDTASLPAGVYARGYLATYAEFLGFAPESAVTPCLGARTAASQSSFTAMPASPTRRPVQQDIRAVNWRGLGVLAALLLGMGFLLAQCRSTPEEEAASLAPRVAPVPDELLDVLRTAVMPRPEDAACLLYEDTVACQYDNPVLRELGALDAAAQRQALWQMQLPEATLQWLALPTPEANPDPTEPPSEHPND